MELHSFQPSQTHFCLLLIITIFTAIFIRRLFQPTSRVPGPFLTRFTSLPLIRQDNKSNRTLWTISLHKKYGPIVRLSPNEISISSKSSMTDVYTGTFQVPAFPKGPLYEYLTHYGARNCSSSISPASHTFHRKIVGSAYTQSIIGTKEALNGKLWKAVGNYMNFLHREGTPGAVNGGNLIAVDIYRINSYYATDAATSHFFLNGSEALRGDETVRRWVRGSTEKPDEVLTYVEMEFRLFTQVIKSLLTRFRDPFGRSRNKLDGRKRDAGTSKGSLIQNGFYGGTEIKDWNWKSYMATREALENGSLALGEEVVASKLASNVILGENAEGIEQPTGEDKGLRIRRSQGLDGQLGAEVGRWIRNESAASELMDGFFAAIDPVADTLDFIIYLLSLPEHEQIQKKLQLEVGALNLPSSYDTPLSKEVLNHIQSATMLDSVIKETLRCYPPSSISKQRVVPQGGRTLDGFFIPGGTIIGAPPAAINWNEELYSGNGKWHTRTWIPQRWYEGEPAKVKEMDRRLFSFGTGARVCLGRNLAMWEMKLLLARIYSKFSTVIDNTTEVTVDHARWSSRVTFRDVKYFQGVKGVIGFISIEN